MLRSISPLRHVVVAAGVLGTAALGAFGVVGAGDDGVLRSEHFDAKQVVVTPAGVDRPDGVRIREVVDIDFGSSERRGYQRIVPNDFGAPVDVTASSPDADATLDVLPIGRDTRLRIGDPAITFTGQRRYVLEYTLPDAQLASGRLALDVIGTDEALRTDRFEVDLVGFELSDPSCDVGTAGQFGGCTLERVSDGRYRAVVEPLEAREGISVFADVDAVVDTAVPEPPALPDRVRTGFRPLGLLQLGIGALIALAIHRWFRRSGSNVVFGAGGAADAAHGELASPLGVPREGDPVADVPTHRVPDDRLAELATIEFSPPRGVEPWQGYVLLRERVDDDSVSAWFSEMIGREAIVVTGEGSDLVLRPGQATARLSAVDRSHLAQLFERGPAVELGTYDPAFTSVWSRIRAEQKRLVDSAGWWDSPLSGSSGSSSVVRVVVYALVALFVLATTATSAAVAISVFGAFGHWLGAVALTVVVTIALAVTAYWTMLASRTATGSALALRTESFRRFLEASEARHVEWAWEHGLVREYSAWAVALGEATAWSAAIESSDIAHPERFTAPLLVHSYGSSFRSARTPPSSSGSGGGGGGFSGGGVGGGGGGGSSGSW
ncbi:DUF2207 family protein [Ilumatobacter sp.]|uniref:DUF2207 family protein n=1 Tax=Ilumatobacter sp. TaxID=1967498 RepID=UPI003B5286D1